jgi:hypothetical protein
MEKDGFWLAELHSKGTPFGLQSQNWFLSEKTYEEP